jgi:hypothetical protein
MFSGQLLSSADQARASRQFFQLGSMMSGFPVVAKSSPARNPPEVKVSSPITSIDYSIAIDPIEYIGMPFSFYYLEPDSNIVDDDRMPGKPSSPLGPVFGFYFHCHPSFRLGPRTMHISAPRRLEVSRPDYELDFSRSKFLMSYRE